MRRLRCRGDRGLTLVELLFTVVLLGVISGAIATIMFVFFRANRSTADSLANSGYAQTLATWFPADVQSAEPSASFGTESAGNGDTGCQPGDLAPYGTNELRLVLYPGDSPMVVSYRVDAANEQLLRVTCSGGGSPKRQVMVQGVRSADDVSVELDTFETAAGAEVVSNVRMTVTMTREGRTSSFTVAASPRAVVPVTTLDPGPGGPGPSPTDPCTLVGTASPVLEMLAMNTTSALSRTEVVVPATLQVTTSGACGADLRISFDKHPGYLFGLDRGPELLSLDATGTPGLWTYTFTPDLPGGSWHSGSRPVTVERLVGAGWETIGTFNLDVRQAPCLFDSGSLSPSPVLLTGSGTTQSVAGSYQLTVNLSGVCSGVDVRANVETRPGNTEVRTLNGSGLVRTLTINGSFEAGLWTDGVKTVTVERRPGSTWQQFDPPASFQFDAETDLCTFVSGSVAPQPVMITTASNGSLTQPVDIAVTTNEGCGAQLRGLIETRGGNTVPVALSSADGTSWAVTLPADFEAGRWSAGQRQVTLERNIDGSWVGFNPPAVLTFNATNPVCTVLDVASDPDPVELTGTSGSSRSLDTSFVLTIETNAFCGNQLRAVIETRTTGTNRTGNVTMSGGPTSWFATVPTSFQANRWAAGGREVTVERRQGIGWSSVSSHEIEAATAPCRYINGSISGAPLLLSGTGGDDRSVIGSYPVNVSTTSTCGDVRLRFETRPGDETTVNLSGTGSTTITDSTAAGRWSDGTKTVLVEHRSSGQWVPFDPPAQFQLTTATAPCQLVTHSAPAVVYLSGSGSSRSVSAGPYEFSVQTTPDCGQLRMQFQTRSGNTVSLPMAGGPTSWSASLANGMFGNAWSTGSKAVTIQRCTSGCASNANWSAIPGGTFSFESANACAATGSVADVRLSRSGILFFYWYSVRNGPYTISVSVDGPGCGGSFRVGFPTDGNSSATLNLSASLTAQITNSLNQSNWSPGTKTVTVEQCLSGCGNNANWTAIGTFTFEAVYP